MKRRLLICGMFAGALLGAALLGSLALSAVPAAAAPQAAPAEQAAPETRKPDEEALERARQTVRMLDDIYKATVMLITDKYVHDEADFPAGSAAVALFQTITDKGWHEVRLLDASGDPINPENVARDAFEKRAIQQLKSGESYVEKLVQKEGRYQLRALTPVPVVMEKCVMCHPHYADVEQGKPIGAISYAIPID